MCFPLHTCNVNHLGYKIFQFLNYQSFSCSFLIAYTSQHIILVTSWAVKYMSAYLFAGRRHNREETQPPCLWTSRENIKQHNLCSAPSI